MADITIKDLTAGTPLLTDLHIFANPTTGLAKKSTHSVLNGVLTLAGLSDVAGAPTNGSILQYGDGEFGYASNYVQTSNNTINYLPIFDNVAAGEKILKDSYIQVTDTGVNITSPFDDNTALTLSSDGDGTYSAQLIQSGSNGLNIQATTNSLTLGNGSVNYAQFTQAGNLNIGLGAELVNNASSILSLTSISKGFLKPRMTTTQRNAIVTPATGLEVFDITLNLPYNYNGTAWKGVQELLISATNIKTVNGNSLLGSGNIIIATGLTTLNTLTAATQTFAVDSTGTDFTISSATSTHTFNLPSASATNRGLLTAANWTTFNNKVGGSGTTNYLSKFTGVGTIGNSLIFDDGTSVLIGTTTPNANKLCVFGGSEFLSATTSGNSIIFGNVNFKWNFNTSIVPQILSLAYGANNVLNIGYDAPNNLINIFSGGNIDFLTNFFTIGGSSNSPIASARFNIESSTKGSIPMPRMSTAQIKAIASPVNGLMAYSIDDFVPCFYDSNTSLWKKFSHSNL